MISNTFRFRYAKLFIIYYLFIKDLCDNLINLYNRNIIDITLLSNAEMHSRQTKVIRSESVVCAIIINNNYNLVHIIILIACKANVCRHQNEVIFAPFI